MKEKRRLRRIKVGCKILDTRRTHTRTVVLDDLIYIYIYIYIYYKIYISNIQKRVRCRKTVKSLSLPEGPPSPPQELEGRARSALNFYKQIK